ncbi:peptidoglycan-binding protein, partial [Nonomuraea sp. AD125B]|uniref:peptidoglycan-binding domain-containing protein n=1 Tax=Nonomuraea sp. AD125B TaxID=3242897 RepID=UPI0035288783
MRSPRRLLAGVVAGVVVVAGAGWAVGARLRSPADEAARRAAPAASLVTAAVERRKLVSTVVLSGMLEYGSPLPVTLAGVVGGGAELQRATRAPRKGRLREGAVLMEVNGRPVFALRGAVPMHRTIAPGGKGDDVRQLQRALRRLGHRAPTSGVFDRATIAAVTRMYAKKGYEAQQPTLTERQTYESLRKAVRTARESLATERQALDRGRDVLPLKVRLDNAEKDLKAARAALAEAEAGGLTPADEADLAAADAAVRAARERLLEAEQALHQAISQPTSDPATRQAVEQAAGQTTRQAAGQAAGQTTRQAVGQAAQPTAGGTAAPQPTSSQPPPSQPATPRPTATVDTSLL